VKLPTGSKRIGNEANELLDSQILKSHRCRFAISVRMTPSSWIVTRLCVGTSEPDLDWLGSKKVIGLMAQAVSDPMTGKVDSGVRCSSMIKRTSGGRAKNATGMMYMTSWWKTPRSMGMACHRSLRIEGGKRSTSGYVYKIQVRTVESASRCSKMAHQ
jgi:hypothetical protein